MIDEIVEKPARRPVATNVRDGPQRFRHRPGQVGNLTIVVTLGLF